jgi:hypothetical protein
MTSTQMLGRRSVVAERSPAVKSSESPGRKKPTIRPDSMKTMTSSPIIENFSIRVSGSSQLGPRARGRLCMR